MENYRTEFLREIEAEIASLKEKVRALEDKLEAFRQQPSEEKAAEESDFTDMEIGVADLPEMPVPEAVDAPAPALEEVAVQAESEEPVEIDLPVEDLPEPEPEPAPQPELVEEPVPEPVEEPKPAPAAPREGTERLPWRLDKPGISVKHIRSGISMYDRALFIGTLFKEDYALYDRTIGDLDTLSNLDEAVDYLLDRFPDWNLKSDIVYNFMMAIRKKLG